MKNKNKQYKGYQYRIYPTELQKTLIEKTFGCVRFIYNTMLYDKKEHYEKTKENLDVHPSHYKKEFPFLKEVDSLALCNAELNLKTAYRNFFTQKSKFPKFKKKKQYSHRSYTTNCINNNIKLNTNKNSSKIILPKIGEVKIKLHRKLPKNSAIKNVTVSCTSTNKYFVSICFEYIPIIIKHRNKRKVFSAVGLDYSSNEFFVGTDNLGNTLSTNDNNLHLYRRSQKKLRKLQRRLSKKKLYSSNWKKANKKVNTVYEKIRKQRKDYLHKLSYSLVTTYDVICLETLNMKHMSQLLSLGKSTMDNGFGMFKHMLEYKAKENSHCSIVYIDKWFPSTKMCHVCGNKINTITLSDREWICEYCHTHHNRDINASINILNEGLRLYYS